MADTNNVSPVAPRGTERVRRRADQAAHAEQAVVEAATLQPLRGEEKVAAIAANKAADVARFGGGENRAKVRQAENRVAAAAQDAEFAGVTAFQKANLVPGQQVDHRTARLIAKAADREARDRNTEAAKAAGKAVFQTLNDRVVGGRQSIHRKIAKQAAKVAATNTQ
jgi:hypothetical protein